MRKKIILFVLSLMITSFVFPAQAQSSVARIVIRDIIVDPSNFPEVAVNGLVMDTDGAPISGVAKEMFDLTENGEPVDFKMAEVASGVRTSLVLDMGKWINNNTVRSRERVKEKMQNLAIRFVDNMKENDQVEIIVVYGQEPSVIQSFTNDRERLREAIQGLDWDNDEESFGLEGIVEATAELTDTPDDLFKRVLFISSGIMVRDVFGKEDSEIAKDLVAQGIPLYSVDVTWQARRDYHYQFESISKDSNGQYFEHVVEEDLNPLFLLLDNRRNIYQFTFRSIAGESTERTVTLNYLGTSDVSDSKAYTVDSSLIAPANVQILVNNGEPILVTAENPNASVPIHIMIDGLGNREIRNIIFQVNGEPYGTLNETGSGTFSTTWQIAADTLAVGNNEVFLEVLAEDELGIPYQGSAALSIRLEAPANALCRGLTNLPGIGTSLGNACVNSGFTLAGLFNIILSLAIITLGAVVWFKRDKLLKVGKDLGVRVTTAVDRLTARLRTSDPKARLVALQGVSEGERTQFDLFGETPIGSNSKYASLIFDKKNISKLHCKIHEGHAGNWTIEDQESTNGTFVNGQRLKPFEEKEIETGAIIELSPVEYGGIKFRFEIVDTFSNDDDMYRDVYKEEDTTAVDQLERTRVTTRLGAEHSNNGFKTAAKVDDEHLDPSDPSNQKW